MASLVSIEWLSVFIEHESAPISWDIVANMNQMKSSKEYYLLIKRSQYYCEGWHFLIILFPTFSAQFNSTTEELKAQILSSTVSDLSQSLFASEYYSAFKTARLVLTIYIIALSMST